MIKAERITNETKVNVQLESVDRLSSISTTLPFLDHMLVAFSRYSGLCFEIEASGDLDHHISEDVAITLGAALAKFVPEKAARYGNATVPMDDALVSAALDIGGRPFYEGDLADEQFDHFFRSLCDNAKFTIHIQVLRGSDRHHIVEAAFKSLGFSLRQALIEGDSIFSTKGSVSLEVTEC